MSYVKGTTATAEIPRSVPCSPVTMLHRRCISYFRGVIVRRIYGAVKINIGEQ